MREGVKSMSAEWKDVENNRKISYMNQFDGDIILLNGESFTKKNLINKEHGWRTFSNRNGVYAWVYETADGTEYQVINDTHPAAGAPLRRW
jgi:hypothetical protein